ncbi:MAG TPA: hypothetical protein VMU51_12185 [Mycobacteriales bacterium]|nr:hypothetical protein [Mycobacteriales bacterium]
MPGLPVVAPTEVDTVLANRAGPLFLLVGGLLVGGLVAGCTGPPAAPAATPSPTYLLPSRTARYLETPIPSASAVSGSLMITVMGLRAHLPALTGTHAEFRARGEFVRVRISVENIAATFYDLLTSQQLLLTDDGAARPPDLPAMEVTRQPDDISLGAQDRIEVDLWYDIPRGRTLRGLRVTIKDGPARDIPLPAT